MAEKVKVKKEKKAENKLVPMEETPAPEMTYEERAARAAIVAKPMAPKKLAKRVFKLIRKATKQKQYLRSGLKVVQTKIRKGETGIAVFAGDLSPIDVACHLPCVCEDKGIPYIYVPTGKELGTAMGVNRCSLCVLIRPHGDYKELYDEIAMDIKGCPIPWL